MLKITKKKKNGTPKVETSNVETAAAAAAKPVMMPSVTKPKQSMQPKVALELLKPGAKQVFVAGSFNEWRPERAPLVQVGNGQWKGELAVAPGRHEYLFVVDGQWVPDPNARETTQNPYGGKNSVLIVAE
jgi:1,4-alpha-glucan branching enzyme